ncbi:transcriptional regulator with XRE-family HTH domain [Rhizobium paknamense]|uniref:Transcriptional regulator with XRE-family HTH domain n=1 Tax=Rhizobium paknamense TaxID=1206817 RepID=A0ABU0I8W3_9HYPH|nr:transcriptional regulator with XRE-family HTH domain [Rhizobium paknamense]
MGVAKNTMASYERGDTEPTASVLAAYREMLNINLNWLATGQGEMLSSEGVAEAGLVAELAVEIRKLPPARQQLVLGMMRSIVNHELHK